MSQAQQTNTVQVCSGCSMRAPYEKIKGRKSFNIEVVVNNEKLPSHISHAQLYGLVMDTFPGRPVSTVNGNVIKVSIRLNKPLGVPQAFLVSVAQELEARIEDLDPRTIYDDFDEDDDDWGDNPFDWPDEAIPEEDDPYADLFDDEPHDPNDDWDYEFEDDDGDDYYDDFEEEDDDWPIG